MEHELYRFLKKTSKKVLIVDVSFICVAMKNVRYTGRNISISKKNILRRVVSI
jgi:hypothetical protein